MAIHKIKNLGTPRTNKNDNAIKMGFFCFNTELNASNSNLSTQLTTAYERYLDESHVMPSRQRDAFWLLMEDMDDSSSENNINVTGMVDFSRFSHQLNKKAYEFTLIKDKDG